MRLLQLVLGIAIGAIAVVFAAQNTEIVDITLLGWTVSTSRALMIIVVLVFGIVLGWIAGSFRRRRRSQ